MRLKISVSNRESKSCLPFFICREFSEENVTFLAPERVFGVNVRSPAGWNHRTVRLL